MDPQLYLAFLIATVLLVLLPGPNVTLIVANSLAYGHRQGLLTVAGTSSATAIQLVLTVLGMTSVLVILSQWFDWLRWAGVAYLVYLGVQHWRVSVRLDDTAAASPQRLYWRGFLVAATNPKTILFYIAFFPQFIDPAGAPLPQLVLLSITFLVVATLLDSCYALLAARTRRIIGAARWARLRNRLTGTLLIAAGFGLALARRSSTA